MGAHGDTVEVPVLIVGAGAGGLTAAAVLAKHGVESLVVEQRQELFRYPKARNLSFRSLEILRGLGLSDAAHAVGASVSDMVMKPSLDSTEETPGLDVGVIFQGLENVSPEPPVLYCPQSRLEPLLLEFLRDHSSRAWYGTALVALEQDDNGAHAIVCDRTSGRRTHVRAGYVIAADGVHSGIRTSLGITTSGYGPLPIYVATIYFRAPWRTVMPHLHDGASVGIKNEAVDGVFVPAEGDLAMFIAPYLPTQGETAADFTDRRCRALLRAALGRSIDVEIMEITTWQPYERVADQFRCGRVFFVGDAAHAMPPFKAGGANVAIQSADNLAWKLAAVLQACAGPLLLDTYHSERHPIGALSAHQSLTGPPAALLRTDPQRPPPHLDHEVSMFALLIGYRYRSAAIIRSDPHPANAAAPELVDALRGQPGTRVPHTWVEHQGRRVSTLDLLGTGFTLLTGDDNGAWEAASRSLEPALTVRAIGRGGDALDVAGSWADVTRLTPRQAILVRPDAFIAWRSSPEPTNPADALHDALASLLNHNDPSQPPRPGHRN
ncbi:FAD-dependent monooxygenase [Mycolicibacterium sphagni]|uniref:FAD-dependent monooxygenase n=1 Tax=Mycolicibacterium sphagni TaxID=1786 RepID=UPI0021F28D89|nr:FAD-dependent monooxygenase [Mycolicibacterium sphagni]MCV7174986.1 FAD-dependent monooxygenase [Mycolicibacterium sphagni]